MITSHCQIRFFKEMPPPHMHTLILCSCMPLVRDSSQRGNNSCDLSCLWFQKWHTLARLRPPAAMQSGSPPISIASMANSPTALSNRWSEPERYIPCKFHDPQRAGYSWQQCRGAQTPSWRGRGGLRPLVGSS